MVGWRTDATSTAKLIIYNHRTQLQTINEIQQKEVLRNVSTSDDMMRGVCGGPLLMEGPAGDEGDDDHECRTACESCAYEA